MKATQRQTAHAPERATSPQTQQASNSQSGVSMATMAGHPACSTAKPPRSRAHTAARPGKTHFTGYHRFIHGRSAAHDTISVT